MFSGGGAYSIIKDLKDLSVLHVRGFYRHAGPKGPEEMFFAGVIAGDRPPRYGEKNVPLTVGRGPVPRHATNAGDRPPRYGSGRGSPRHAPFGIGCSRTTVASRSVGP